MATPTFDTIEAQASYGIGLQVGQQLSESGLQGLLPEALVAGIADALEGNLFKMCSWGGRITRYWIKYCRDYASSAEAVKIGINAKQKTNCVKFNLIAPLLARFIPELTRFSAWRQWTGRSAVVRAAPARGSRW